MVSWLPRDNSSAAMSEQSCRESVPAATISEPSSLHRNRINTRSLDVRGAPVKVRVNMLDLGTLSHAYEFRVHDLTQWLDRWDVDAVKKNAETYLCDRLDFPIRRRHFELELWLPTYQHWEPLPYDSKFEEVATRYNMQRNQEYWDFILRLNQGRTPENCGDW